MTTLLFCQCFHDQEIREFVNKDSNVNETIKIGAKNYTQADVIFNLQTSVPGETLRLCSPFFSNQFVGIDKDALLEMLTVHFDSSYVIEDVLLYNGPAKYLINDYTAYFNDVFPKFSPYARNSDDNMANLALTKVAEYNNDFNRVRRHNTKKTASPKTRVARASYTFTSRNHKPPPRIVFNSGSAFTMSVQYLLDTPKLRYEFDIIQAAHYNTSFSYYKSLRHFAATASIDFNDVTSHSAFKAVGNITLLEIMRGMNPFDLYAPRLNIIRELISGYDMEGDIKKLRRMAVKANVQMEYSDIASLIGLFYLIEYPTDLEGFRKISQPEQWYILRDT